ncbi:MAG: hypothetical protein WBC07_10330 [Methylotenera sp.]
MTIARFTIMTFLTFAFAALAAQFVIDFSTENIAAACIVLASSIVVLLYINWTEAIQTHPLSTFAIFGFCMTTQLGALLAQSASWASLANGLRQPIETFATLAMFQGVAVIAHIIYRGFTTPKTSKKSSLIRNLFEKLGLYSRPSAGTLWVMGLIGLFNLLIGFASQSASTKVSQGIMFLAWAPFLIPMYVIQDGPSYCDVKKNYFFLFFFMSVIVLIGLAVNARGPMLSGFMTIALFALLTAMRSIKPVVASKVMKIGMVGILISVLSIPLADLATAMVIARKSRDHVSAAKMIENTIYYFQQPDLIKAYQEKGKVLNVQSNYDETYFASPLVSRLVETKFHDNTLYFSAQLSSKAKEDLMKITSDFFWTTLPDPMLKLMGVDLEKKNMKFSIGDYVTYLTLGGNPLGYYRTGSALAQGLAILGPVFPIIYLIICLILFLAMDFLAFRASSGQVFISALGMLGIWRLFQYGITAESLHLIFMSVVRGLPQNIALYLTVYYVSQLIVKLLASVFRVSKSQVIL